MIKDVYDNYPNKINKSQNNRLIEKEIFCFYTIDIILEKVDRKKKK